MRSYNLLLIEMWSNYFDDSQGRATAPGFGPASAGPMLHPQAMGSLPGYPHGVPGMPHAMPPPMGHGMQPMYYPQQAHGHFPGMISAPHVHPSMAPTTAPMAVQGGGQSMHEIGPYGPYPLQAHGTPGSRHRKHPGASAA